MKNFTKRCVAGILFAVGTVASLLPEAVVRLLGGFAGLFLRLASGKRREITRENLRHAFPDMDIRDRELILRQSYRNLGTVMVESAAMAFASAQRLSRKIEYRNVGAITEAVAEGRGVVLLSGHFGNWELMALALPWHTGVRTSIITKGQTNPWVDEMLRKARTRSGNSLVDMNGAGLAFYRILKAGGVVALLADQSSHEPGDVYVDFFGRKALTHRLPAMVALRLGSPVVMGFAVRDDDGRYVVELSRLDTSGIENTPEGVEELTRRHVAVLEQHIRRHPGQWAWQHKRWKHA